MDTTNVRYKAIADFTSLARAARNAKRSLRELREEESRLNRESVLGSARATIANNKRAESIRNVARAQTEEVNSVRQSAVRFVEQANAASKASRSNEDLARTSRQAASETKNLGDGMKQVSSETRTLSNGVTTMLSRWRRVRPEFRGAGKDAGFLITKLDQMNGSFRKLGDWRPRLTPPFVALIPIIAGVLGLINPLVAGFGAVGAAAIGFGASLGSVAGSALAAVPALGTLLSIVFALKAAFSGIGGAFSSFGKMKNAGGGGGGGGPTKEELTYQEELQRAQEKYRRAIEDVHWAQEDLDEARKGYLKRLKDLRQEVDRIAISEARAAANAQLAREDYANVLADPGSTKGQKMAAKAALEEAQSDLRDLREENKKLREDLAEMEKKGMSGDRSVIQAQRRLTDALWAQRDAQLALINAQNGANKASGGGASAANAYQDALNKLSPSARKFVETIVAMDEAWTKLKKNVQERFFSQFVDDVDRIRLLFGPLESLLGDAAEELGKFARNFIMLVTSPAWREDIILFGKGNIPIIRDLGSGVLFLLDGIRNLAMAAQPALQRLVAGFERGSEALSGMIASAREDGSLAAFLDRSVDSLAQWWRIIKNIGKTLFNYGKAAGDFTQWLMGGFEKTTEGWLKSSEEALGPNSTFRKYLEDVKPLISEIKGLFGDFFRWFAREAADENNIGQMTEILKHIRDDLGPALGKLLDQLADAEIGPKFIDAISKLVEIITALADSPAVETFFTVLNFLLDVLKWVVSIPGVGALLGAIASGFAAIAAVSLVGKFTGITNLIKWLLKLSTGGKNLPALLSKIFGAFGLAGAAGMGGAAGRRGTKDGVKGTGTRRTAQHAAPRRGLAGLLGALGLGAAGAASSVGKSGVTAGQAGAVSAFTRNMALLATQFGLTGVAKDKFIVNLRLLSAQFAATGGAAMGAAGKGRRGAKGARGGAKGARGGVPIVAGSSARAGAAHAAPKAGKGFNLLSSIGKGAGRGAGLGAIASIGGTIVGDLISSSAKEGKSGSGQRVGGNALAGAASGAGLGALIGSIVPGLGTAIGAALGGLVGGGIGVATSSPEDVEQMLSDWGDFFTSVGEWLASVTEGFMNWLTVDLPDWLGSVADGFMQWLTVDLPGWLASIGEGFMQWLTVDMPAWLASVWDGFMTWLTVDLPYWIGYVGMLFLTWLTVDMPAWLASVWNGFMTWLTVDMPAWLASVWNGFMTWLTVDMPAWLASVWNSFMQWLTIDLPAWVASVAASFWKWLTVEVPGAISRAATAFWNWLTVDIPKNITTAANDFMRWLTVDIPKWLQTAANDFMNWLTVDIPRWFREALGNIGSFFDGIFGNIKRGAEDAAGGKRPNPKGSYHGGPVLRRANGGGVPGTRSNSDTVRAMLTPGEYVVRKAIVDRVGIENLEKFNAGVMSYAEMLQTAMRNANDGGKSKNVGGGTEGVSFFNGGGLVPDLPGGFGGFGGATPPPSDFGGGSAGGGGSAPVIGGDLVINNPAPEPASDSLPRSIRKVAYLGGGR